MKKTLLLFLLLNTGYVLCQNIFNPYYFDSATNQYPSQLITIPVGAATPLAGYTWSNKNLITGYSGEYEISMIRHPWRFYTAQGSPPQTLHLSYSMEVVSFPFMPSCTFLNNGCQILSNQLIRPLYLPHDPYNNTDKSWGDLSNVFTAPEFSNTFDQTLASNAFVRTNPLVADFQNKILPHTVIKHTVYIHCGSEVNSPPYPPVLYSFSWVYDNTRGRMRYYPPCNCNCTGLGGCTQDDWDITFIPEILTYSGHNYNESDPTVLMPSGTLDYFPYSELSNLSTCTLPVTTVPIQNACYLCGATYSSPYFPPYSLVSSPAWQNRGKNIAGYKEIPGSNDLQIIGGIQHQYFADENIVLTDINPIEKIFYNPSDVTITAPNLLFPSNYSFRTIRGVYPSPAEVQADNTAINGGPFNDPRDVPVRTDLRCEDATFPHDASIPDDAKYASLYRLAAGSKLTLEPCVRVFDAAFILNPGSTLELANKTSIIGLHRVAIDRNGGRLIEKYELNNGTLYLQDKTETALAPNSYYVNSKIFAGENVDVSSPVGPYIASIGTNLELIARDYIKLDHGFHAEPGSEVKIQIDPFMQIPSCPPPASGGSGNRFANLSANSIVDATAHIKLLPTLFTNSTGIYSENKNEDPIVSVEVLDASGKKIKQINEINDYFIEVDISNMNDGMYFFLIQTKNNRKVLKGVKQN